ncbi:MAG: cupin domain-containing protein [Burkholderiales bacterium]|nr:cupin domain-containing protein [Burkholderiales bacterium]
MGTGTDRDKHGRQLHDLATGDIRRVAAGRGTVIRCLDGLLWVTQEGDPLDHMVPAGARYCSAGTGLVVASAIRDGTRIAVHRVDPVPAADWTRNVVRVDAGFTERLHREARQEMARWFAAMVTGAARRLRQAWQRFIAPRGRVAPGAARGYHGRSGPAARPVPEPSMNKAQPPTAIVAAEAPPKAKQTNYPEPFAARVAGRLKRPLGDLFGLRNFGVNLTRLAPGAVSALRHAHSAQDEFIYVLEGRPVLVTAAGETPLAPGMCAGFRAGSGDAHQLVNRGDGEVVYLEVGDRGGGDRVVYPDDDLQAVLDAAGQWAFMHKDGRRY